MTVLLIGMTGKPVPKSINRSVDNDLNPPKSVNQPVIPVGITDKPVNYFLKKNQFFLKKIDLLTGLLKTIETDLDRFQRFSQKPINFQPVFQSMVRRRASWEVWVGSTLIAFHQTFPCSACVAAFFFANISFHFI
jgi:hypothetical protein